MSTLSACQSTPIATDKLLSDASVAETDSVHSPTQAAAAEIKATLGSQATPSRDTTEPYVTSDRPDVADGYQIHFIYALPSDATDSFLDLDGRIELAANAMNNWLQSHTEHRLRYDTYQGKLDITFLRLDHTVDEISELGTGILPFMDYEIKTRGFDSSHKLFVVHYDGFFVSDEGFCGLAQFPPDGAGNTAVLLLRGYNPSNGLTCPRSFTKSADYVGFFEMTILHELLHLMGIVPSCAPNAQDGHVSDSPQDLMYYQYDGSFSPLYTYLDYHNDDYYKSSNPDCPDFSRSVFLDPLPENAETPPGWEISSNYIQPNPFDKP
ncbi:MAG TPA: hypothetical protein VLK33_08555 [Terriglobales bacterium]|nr:hypothetical protein [Terriglobales bacterium]